MYNQHATASWNALHWLQYCDTAQRRGTETHLLIMDSPAAVKQALLCVAKVVPPPPSYFHPLFLSLMHYIKALLNS